ncbi:MAG: hypothetical protein ACE369_05765 [Roseovarius sp.]
MHRQQRAIDYTGLNLIRIVIGSYFMAIALGLINGVWPEALFVSVVAQQTADLFGTVLLFSITAAFMLGLFLRLTSLMLAIFVFASSAAQNLILSDTMLIEPFWRDLTMGCAVLLSYSCLKRSELNRVALVWRRSTPRLRNDQTVIPRRVTPSNHASTRVQPKSVLTTSLKPLMQAAAPPARPAVPKGPRLVPKTEPRREEPEIENIFAAL